mgnify:FL=1
MSNNSLENCLTLILNASYLPLGICSSKRAICLCLLEKVSVISEYSTLIHSPSINMKIPSIVRLNKYVKFHSKDMVLNRKNLFLRDNASCQYCGCSKSSLTIDHIIPKGKGGEDSWTNLVVACSSCNIKKGNRTPKEANMPLRKDIKKPNSLLYFNQFVNSNNSDWKQFLF